jgi:hypothetical protein
MLSNQTLPALLRNMTDAELIEGDTLFSFLFRESFARAKMPKPKPQRDMAILVLRLYGQPISENLRASQQAAAARWGADYVEVTRPIFPWQDPFWEKLHLDVHGEAYCRVVYLDADVAIRSDCPSLFDLVPEDHFGAVAAEQQGHWMRHNIDPHMHPMTRALGVQLDISRHYFNSGVLVFSPKRHANAFRAARWLSVLTEDRNWVWYDQGCISLALEWLAYPRTVLPPSFNRCGDELWSNWSPVMRDPIWHFGGQKTPTVLSLMDQTRWQISAN